MVMPTTHIVGIFAVISLQYILAASVLRDDGAPKPNPAVFSVQLYTGVGVRSMKL